MKRAEAEMEVNNRVHALMLDVLERNTEDENHLADLRVLRKSLELKSLEVTMAKFALPDNDIPLEDKKAAYQALDGAVAVLKAFTENHTK